MQTAKLAFGVFTLLLAGTGWAADFQISATTIGQGYEVGAADGSVVARRRLSQFVRLNGYNLADDNKIFFVSSFRLDADFGLTDTDLSIPGNQYLRQDIRGLSQLNLTLMYGYLAGRNLYGWLDFDAGRQFVIDLVDFFNFDGIRLAVNTPWYFGVEAYAGFEVRAGAPLGAAAFDLPGVAEVSDLAPTYGFGIFLRDAHWGKVRLFGKATYRKTQASRSLEACTGAATRFDCDRLDVVPSEASILEKAFSDKQITEERFSTNLQLRAGPVWMWGGFSYNLVNGWFDDLLFGAQARLLGKHLLLRAEYLRSRPRFDADSIFNIFSTNAIDDVRVRASWTLDNGISIRGQGYVRFFQNDTILGTVDSVTATGFVVGTRVPHGKRSYTTFDLRLQTGYGGTIYGGDVWSRFTLMERKLALDGRILLLRFDDDRLSNLHGLNFTLQGGVRYQIHRTLALHLILEESVNRLYSSIFRVYGLVDVSVWL